MINERNTLRKTARSTKLTERIFISSDIWLMFYKLYLIRYVQIIYFDFILIRRPFRFSLLVYYI